ncbi:MAG: chromosome segregation protein SMC, partial [Verrucomicrobia bacterium]|nr:chromosome segregation protein SMC [Leptolyngbya sp. ES-bin-22]
GMAENEVFSSPVRELILNFFASENLTLPPGQSWREVKADVFKVVNGKKLLFENPDSLFQRLKSYEPPLQSISALELTREIVAAHMIADEIHEDVHQFFNKLSRLLS